MDSVNRSLASDLPRIVLLGIAFDLSRFVAGKIVDAVSSSLNADKATSSISDTNCKCRNSCDAQSGKCNVCEKRRRDNSGRTTESDPTLTFPTTTLIDRFQRHFNNIYTKYSKLQRHNWKIAWLVLPPPLLLCGICNRQLSRSSGNDKSLQQPSVSLIGGICLASVITSLGLLFWFHPGVISNNTDGDYMNPASEGNQQCSEYQPMKILEPPPIRLTNATTQGSIIGEERLVHISAIPSLVPTKSRPPLPPNDQEERRPRSDSLRSMVSECSVTSQPNTPVVEKIQKKYLEILVHNVSHTDLILGLSGVSYETKRFPLTKTKKATVKFGESEHTSRKSNERNNKTEIPDDDRYILSRPRFSAFDLFSRRVLSELSTHSSCHPLQQKVISYPRYERSNASARYTLVTPRPSDQYMLPVGFNLERVEEGNTANTNESNCDELSVDSSEMPSLRLRGRDLSKVDPAFLGETPRKMNVAPISSQLYSTPTGETIPDSLRINAVFFPLLSTLLPRWLGLIADRYGGEENVSKQTVAALPHNPNVKKVIVLVSGVGSPRNWTHSISGNSTKACAELMELFISILYPDVTVVK